MRRIILFSMLFIFLPPAQAQEKEKWKRIATYDDSIIELDLGNVTLSTEFSGRVRFRISLSKPDPISQGSPLKYKSVIETVEFKCEERLYRLYEVVMFDPKGKVIDTGKGEPETEWKRLWDSRIWSQLYPSACDLIAEKKRNP